MTVSTIEASGPDLHRTHPRRPSVPQARVDSYSAAGKKLDPEGAEAGMRAHPENVADNLLGRSGHPRPVTDRVERRARRVPRLVTRAPTYSAPAITTPAVRPAMRTGFSAWAAASSGPAARSVTEWM